MKIVIDIPKKTYEELKTRKVINAGETFSQKLIKYIRNGTPLPKGHGRLKDIDKIISDGTSKGFCDWYDEMKYAPTIIEAESEEEC